MTPAAFFTCYFAAMTGGGIGWSIHLWPGAIFTAGVIGLFVDELSRGSRSAQV